jgi:hypothetical protein
MTTNLPLMKSGWSLSFHEDGMMYAALRALHFQSGPPLAWKMLKSRLPSGNLRR